jgi:hypothetical protein
MQLCIQWGVDEQFMVEGYSPKRVHNRKKNVIIEKVDLSRKPYTQNHSHRTTPNEEPHFIFPFMQQKGLSAS